MTYIELINNFWQQFEDTALKPNDVLLYFFLLKECNRRSWRNPFSLPNKSIVLVLDISEKSVIESRNRLVERRFIDYEKGDRNCTSPKYRIINAPEPKFNLPTESRTEDERQMNGSRTEDERQMPINNKEYKTKDYKTKDKSPDGDSAPTDAPTQRVIDFGKDKKKRQSKPREPFTPPTLEEVRLCFLEKKADKRIQDWEMQFKLFYSNYESVGWRISDTKSIRDWKARVENWIITREIEHQNENNKKNRLSEHRGTDPDARGEQGFDSSFQS